MSESSDYGDNTTHCCICTERVETEEITCPTCKSVFHKENLNEYC